MNNKMQKLFESLMLATFFTMLLSGCSLTGFMIGSGIDAGKFGEVLPFPAGLDSVAPGSEVRILKKDHTLVEGVYVSRDSIEKDVAKGISDTVEYRTTEHPQNFEKWRTEWVDTLGLRIGTKITVTSYLQTLVRRDQYNGTFVGFNPGVIMIESKSGAPPLRIRLEFVEEVTDSMGKHLATREQLIRVANRGVRRVSATESFKKFIPCIVIGEGRQSRVPMEEIEAMLIHESGNAKWIGLCIGVTIDMVLAAVIAEKLKGGFLGGGRWF